MVKDGKVQCERCMRFLDPLDDFTYSDRYYSICKPCSDNPDSEEKVWICNDCYKTIHFIITHPEISI